MEIIGNRVSDYYVRNIYIEVSLQIALLWILVPSNYLIKTLAKLFKNTYNKCYAVYFIQNYIF